MMDEQAHSSHFQGTNKLVARGTSSEIQVIHLTPTMGVVDATDSAIDRHNWASTALGPLPQWSPSLRIAVDMMLLSPFPSAVVWGSELTVIHNPAYHALLRGREVSLGCGFDTLWGEHWESIGPWVFKALAGQANFIEDAPVRVELKEEAGHGWFAFSYAPIRDESGAVAGLLHTVVETSASVESISQWRELAQTFENQVARYMADRDHMWQLSRDVMVMVDRDFHLQATNPAWGRALGWEEAQIAGTSILDLVHPADRQEVRTAMLGILHGNSVEQIETRLRHQDGYYRWFRWSAKIDGDRLTAVGQDISQAREDALRQTELLLRNSQRMEAVGQLAGGMAHEMNNLLSGIGGSLELLQRRIDEGRLERIDNYVSLARDSVQRAMSLTHRLLAFSKNQPLNPQPVDTQRVLPVMAPSLLQTLGAEMALIWQLDVQPWPVRLDACHLQNALVNLCANAREACLGRGKVTIRSTNQRLGANDTSERGLPAGDYLAISVEDNGHGMSAQDVERAFEPFFTTQPAGRGAGLGLPMVYGFVRQSDGRVWIESTLEQGTRVTMLFPRCFEPLPPELPEPSPATQLIQGQGERLLLVDDESNLRRLMKEVLVEHGFVVCDVVDANAALGQFRNGGAFDLVITDIGLPGGFSGRQVAKAMRLLKPEQKILFITGYTESPVEAQLLDEPGTELMLKPFSLMSLVARVQQMLHS